MKIFVTGTDTEVGKTYISAGILQAFTEQGLKTLGLKPIASGGLADTQQLQQASSLKIPISEITPFHFTDPIAPHIAAQKIQQEITVAKLQTAMQPALSHAVDLCLIEGFGGWYAPLNSKETMVDFVRANQLPVLLVVGIRLGCINHAILTYKAMQQDGVKLIGWIANCLDSEMRCPQENIETVGNFLSSPCLGVVNYKEKVSDKINLETLRRTNVIPKSCHPERSEGPPTNASI